MNNLNSNPAGIPAVTKNEARTIMPGATIGMLGGGQLGRMTALAGRNMGYRFVTLEPVADCPCAQAADYQVVGAYNDPEALKDFASRADVVTYEFENVQSEAAAQLAAHTYVPQGSALLAITQHRLREKRAIDAAGVAVTPFRAVTSIDDLHEAVEALGLPLVLKTTTGGYDGKGQAIIRELSQVEETFAQFASPERVASEPEPLIAEQFIRFEHELSVIVARNPKGDTRTFPVARNIHKHHILHLSIVPGGFPQAVESEAERMAIRIADALNLVGLLAVEMFLTADGRLYVNEVAPRPHNSGHYTQDACTTSQFEQHVRAVCNLPLGKTQLLTPVVMVNVLGQHIPALMKAWEQGQLSDDQLGFSLKLHLYGKHEAKHGRKMGHLNLLGADTDQMIAWTERCGIWE